MSRNIQVGRQRWHSAIRFFADHRPALARLAKNYYKTIDDSPEFDISGVQFPLLVKRGWIRPQPILLDETTEVSLLKHPDKVRTFSPRLLSGLKGDYVAHKGALACATRMLAKPAPQHNGEIFCAKSVVQDAAGDFVGFDYYLSSYFCYINTCEVLGAELADWAIRHKDENTPPMLPFRGAPEDAYDLENRAAYPGINCLSIFLNYSEPTIGRGDYFLLHKRDETQLQAQNSVHVVPAGGHQGYAKDGQVEDTAIWRTMMREFAEELFNTDDLHKQPETWDAFLKNKNVAKIRDIFFGGPTPSAKAYLHGFGLDPITLKPEVLITIVIDWEAAKRQWPDVRLEFNWELQSTNKTQHQWERLSRDTLTIQARGDVQTIEGNEDTLLGTLPAAAACMMQTVRHYDFLGLSDRPAK